MLQKRKTMTDSAQPFAAKKFLEIKGRRMAYIDEGEGAPIVFAHGNPTSSYLCRNVMPACRGLGRLIACDMIGMGDSAKLRRRRSSSLHPIRNGSPAKHHSSREVFVRHLHKMT